MPGQPVDHPGRLEALADTRLLDSLPEESFDRFTRLARSLLGAEIALITLVDKHRQYFKSESGLGEPLKSTRQNDISLSFCRFVVEGGEPFIVEDAREDPRVRLNPAVVELGVTAYLGMPIATHDGYILGSLCAVGTSPRKWSSIDLQTLADLASAVTREVELIEQSYALQQALGISQARMDLREKDLRTLVHDMRTPAAAVSSCLQFLSRAGETLTTEDHEFIELSRESTRSLLEMMEQILETDRLQAAGVAMDLRTVSISSLLRRVSRVIRPFATDAGVAIDLPHADELTLLKIDEKLIERVFMNLLTNAIKYSPEGGTIRIDVRHEPAPGKPMCRISVADEGPGVPESEKAMIFDQFTTGSTPSQRGMTSFGIGLSFCKSVVEAHGGQLGVKDAPGGGSVFHCLLPASW